MSNSGLPMEYRLGNENGLVLATILVFLVVITLSILSAAALTRTDIQLVTNELNERRAFFYAEAGIAESLLRLGLGSGRTAVVDGTSFDASISPPSGNVNWAGYILFSGSGPATSGNVFTTPTLQPAASRLPYSTAAQGARSLTITWDVCATVNAAAGCPTAGQIRTIAGNKVMLIQSTGQSGNAQRTVTWEGYLQKGLAQATVLFNQHKAVNASGSSSLHLTGALQVNSAYSDGIYTSGSASVAASEIDMAASSSTCASCSPAPKVNQPSASDPLASLPVPDPVALGLPIRSLTQYKLSGGASATISPGVYVGGINVSSSTLTMNPGIYIMQGGGFTFSGSSTCNCAPAGGVMIYNGDNPLGSGLSFGAVTISGGSTMNFAAPSSGTYAGVLLFQARANNKVVTLSGGSAGTIDGALYAPNANLTLSGGSGGVIDSSLVVGSLTLSGPSTLGNQSSPIGPAGGMTRIAWRDF